MPRQTPPPAALMLSADDAEAQFYEAMQTGDIERMMAIWADDDEVVCVHPGGERVIGPAAIRASFEAIFAQNAVPVQPEQVHRLLSQDAAIHHLAERVTVMTPQGQQTAWALATNVYLKTPLGWRMVAHHASPGQLGETPPGAQGDFPSTLH
jgi:uncharacterized protein (TIGR02246 family)